MKRIILFILLAIICYSCQEDSSSPSPIVKNKYIFYNNTDNSSDNSIGETYRMDTETGQIEKVMNNAIVLRQGESNTNLIYVSVSGLDTNDNKLYDVYVADYDLENPRLIEGLPTNTFLACYASADISTLALCYYDEQSGGHLTIAIYNIEDNDYYTIYLQNMPANIDISPDKKKLACQYRGSSYDDGEVIIYELPGGNPMDVEIDYEPYINFFNVKWYTDCNFILQDIDDKLYKHNLLTGEIEFLLTGYNLIDYMQWNDEKMICYNIYRHSYYGKAEFTIGVCHADGSNAKVLTNDLDYEYMMASELPMHNKESIYIVKRHKDKDQDDFMILNLRTGKMKLVCEDFQYPGS